MPAAKRGLGFTANVLTTLGVSLASVPVIISVAGSQRWGELALGQAVGSAFIPLVGWGWSAIGPATLATLDKGERCSYFRSSVKARGVLALVGLGPYLALLLLLLPAARFLLPALAGISVVTAAIGAQWFFIGSGQPGRLWVFDTLPRVAGTVLGIALVLTTQDLATFVLAQLAGSLAGTLIGTRAAWSAAECHPTRPTQQTLTALRSTSAGVLTSVGSALYIQAPLVVISLWLPSALPSYALADRIFKFSAVSLSPVTQLIQSMVPARGAMTAGWVVLAVKRVAALGLVVACVFAAALPTAVRILSGATEQVSYAVAAALGVALGGIVVTGVTGLAVLVALGRSRDLAVSTLLGAVVGVPLLCWAASLSLVAVAVVVALTEGVVVTYQLLAIRRALRLNRRASSSWSSRRHRAPDGEQGQPL